MSEPHSQALRRRTSELLKLMKDVSHIELQFGSQYFDPCPQGQEGSGLSAMLR